MKKEKITIVVPCYNEEEALPVFYEEIDKVSKKMKNISFELLFIDDGSSDNTLSLIRDLVKKDSRVRYVSFSRNFGKEAGMYAGLSKATGDFVAIMDVDLQDPPIMVKKMYDIIKNEDYDCVALYTKSHDDYPFLEDFLLIFGISLLGLFLLQNKFLGQGILD